MSFFRSLSLKDSKLSRVLSGLGNKSSSKNIHAFVCAYPARGHISPTLELSYLLVANGVSVTYLTSEYFISRIANSTSKQLELVGLDDGLPSEYPRNPYDYQFHQACLSLQAPVEKLIEDTISKDSSQLYAIISDAFCPWSSKIAEKFNLQWIAFWSSSFYTFYVFHNLPVLIQSGYVASKGGKARQLTDVVEVLTNILDMCVADLPDVLIDGSTPIWFIEFLEDVMKSYKEAKIILGNTFEELEHGILQSLRKIYPLIYPVGPMIHQSCFSKSNCQFKGTFSSGNFDEEKKCLEWLNTKAKKSVLYIAFGSMATLPLDQLHILAEGIKSSGRSFIWVIPNNDYLQNILPNDFLNRHCTKTEENKKEEEEEGSGDGSLNPSKRMGMIISWASQVQVLKHPSIGGFMTHCGWNSTMEAISASIPLIAWPQGAEQSTNAKLIVEEWKVGIRLQLIPNGNNLTGSDMVFDCIKRLFDDKEEGSNLRANMSKLNHLVQKAMLKGGSSHSNLISFIKNLRKI